MSYACPICSASLDPVLRYPRYVCRDCASKTAAADGSHARWIDGIPCYADEAHFGGIAIEVIP